MMLIPTICETNRRICLPNMPGLFFLPALTHPEGMRTKPNGMPAAVAETAIIAPARKQNMSALTTF